MQSSAIRNPSNFEYARQACEYLPKASYGGAIRIYQDLLNDPHLTDWVTAQVGLHDRFFLLTMIMNVGRPIFEIADKPEWIFARCREVEQNPDGYLDLWAREHYKSTIITFAGSIQEMAKDDPIYQELNPADGYFRGPGQEITIAIFSHNNAISRAFVRKIKRECEDNQSLSRLYPNVFWKDPKREAPGWSADEGVILKRLANPNEPTLSGYGLVDGLPTSKHFKLLIYDDTVTERSVSTPEMILKTTDAWELSDFLTSQIHKDVPPRRWMIGTRYNYADTYGVIIARKAAKTRIYPATHDGTRDGNPVLLSEDQWNDKKKTKTARILACQMLQNPLAGDEQEFKIEWMRRYELRPKTINVAILVDPANSKKKGSDNTAFSVIGIGAASNKFLLDGACHKMKLTERWAMLKGLYFKWLRAPGVQTVIVGYERYGMQTDIEHFEEMMIIEKRAFPIEEVSWPVNRLEGAKDDRIRRLIPDHQNWRFFYPYEGAETAAQREAHERGQGYLCSKPIKRRDEDGRIYNLVDKLLNNEYLFFPATTKKDMLDSMSRVYDLKIGPPLLVADEDVYPEHHEDF